MCQAVGCDNVDINVKYSYALPGNLLPQHALVIFASTTTSKSVSIYKWTSSTELVYLSYRSCQEVLLVYSPTDQGFVGEVNVLSQMGSHPWGSSYVDINVLMFYPLGIHA